MRKLYEPINDPDVIRWLLDLWHHGSIGSPIKPDMHHTRFKCVMLDGLAREEGDRYSKKYFLTDTGLQLLIRRNALPDPGDQWRFCKNIFDLTSKIVALEDRWRLSDRGVRVHLPHVWRCVDDLHRQADSDDYSRNATCRYAIHRAGDACEAYLTGELGKAIRFMIELRKMLDEQIAKGVANGFTKAQRDSWRYNDSWLYPDNREALPESPAEQKTGT